MMTHDGFDHLCHYLATILDDILNDEEYTPELVGWYPSKYRQQRKFRYRINKHVKGCISCREMRDAIRKKNGYVSPQQHAAQVREKRYKRLLFAMCSCVDCKGGSTRVYKKEYV